MKGQKYENEWMDERKGIFEWKDVEIKGWMKGQKCWMNEWMKVKEY